MDGGAAPTVKAHNAVWAKATHPRLFFRQQREKITFKPRRSTAAGAPPPEIRRRGRRCRPYRQNPQRCVGQTHTSPSRSGGDCLKLPDFAFAENSPPPKDTNEHLAI